jgi:hypothetical protein
VHALPEAQRLINTRLDHRSFHTSSSVVGAGMRWGRQPHGTSAVSSDHRLHLRCGAVTDDDGRPPLQLVLRADAPALQRWAAALEAVLGRRGPPSTPPPTAVTATAVTPTATRAGPPPALLGLPPPSTPPAPAASVRGAGSPVVVTQLAETRYIEAPCTQCLRHSDSLAETRYRVLERHVAELEAELEQQVCAPHGLACPPSTSPSCFTHFTHFAHHPRPLALLPRAPSAY